MTNAIDIFTTADHWQLKCFGPGIAMETDSLTNSKTKNKLR